MNVEPRRTWSSRAMFVPVRAAAPYEGVAVHWPGDNITLAGKSHDACLKALVSIENYQMDHAGYGAIAYQIIACLHGHLIEGRTKARLNGANGDAAANTRYGSVLALLGIGEKPTDPMLDAILAAPAYLNTRVKLYTHNAVRPEPTACPGPDLTKWINAGYPAPEETVTPEDIDKIADAVWAKLLVNKALPPVAGKPAMSAASTLLTYTHLHATNTDK